MPGYCWTCGRHTDDLESGVLDQHTKMCAPCTRRRADRWRRAHPAGRDLS